MAHNAVVDFEDPFKGCWDRYDRAVAHREAALELWNEFLSHDDAYTISLYMDEEREGVGRGTVRVWQSEAFPPLLPIEFGEYLYNLRAALDYAVYVTAIIDNHWKDPPPGEGVLQFPICETPDSWRKQAYHVQPLNDRHRAWIEQVQPYQGTDDPRVRGIYWINHLARLDRHRELRIIGGWLAESDPLVIGRPGAIVDHDRMRDEVFVEDGTVIASFTISPWAHGDKVETNPQAAIDVELKDFSTGRPPEADWLRMPLGKRLWVMETVIHSEVGRLEYDCVRRTRSEYLDRDWEGFKHPPDP